MTAAVAIKKRDNQRIVATGLVPVLYKRKRVVDNHGNEDAMLAFHTFKCFGGVLNPAAVHGKGHYVRRLTGQDQRAVMGQLQDIAHGLQENIQ